ncbi:MAG: OmpA family protein [Phycisphaerae bacterium]|nr:OmpA family protein [Saprospiraceae bacterium]
MLKSLLTLSLFLGIETCSKAQNLLQNGDFETHGRLDCINCPMFGYKFSAVIPPWKTINGSYPFVCDCQYKKEAAAANDGICDFRKVSPHSGCNMMEFEYTPSCMDQNHKTRGCSAYLGTKLLQALEIGKVYEISLWLYILPSPPSDSAYTQYIGINLYPDAVRNPSGKLLESAAFHLDTVIFGHWYRVKWLVRPVCNLQFLVLGVFRGHDDPPVNLKGHHNRFYIDDVAIREATGIKDASLAITPYCRFSKKEKEEIPEEIDGTICFFNSNDSLLSPLAMAALDSFALRAAANPSTAFIIVGRTDSIGSQHKSLSFARIKSALDYLKETHGVHRFRFLPIGLGTDNPLAVNTTEAGRQQNRSVQIQQMDCPLHMMVYRNVLLHVFAGEKPEAFKLLNIWLNLVPDRKKILALFDPRLDALKSDPKWKAVVIKKVRESYRTQQQPALSFALDSLGLEDQKCRLLNRYVENMQVYLADTDSTDRRWNVSYFSDTSYLCPIRDEAHVQALINLIGNDWPKISEVGERPTKTAFLVVSHTGDTAIIVRYLPLLKQRCQAGEAEWIHFATLSDRMLVHRGLPQRYGTQYQPPSSASEKLRLFPLQNAAMVNEWRKELGLEPLLSIE